MTGDPEFYLKLIRLMRDYPTADRIEYEAERTKAVNRFTLEFLSEFSSSDGDIDWEKLVRFNSGKKRRRHTAKVTNNRRTLKGRPTK